jgi:amino acid transporter
LALTITALGRKAYPSVGFAYIGWATQSLSEHLGQFNH